MKVTVKAYGDVFKVIFHKFNNDGGIGFGAAMYIDSNQNTPRQQDGEKEQSNLYRAKSRIREYALCNDWQYFVTLTLDKDKQDRYDVDGYVRDLGVWIGNYNKKYSAKLKYLLIPEQHKDGAWHMHGLFNGVAADSVCSNAHGYLDMPYYAQRFGYISLSCVRDKTRTAAYITKYVAKALGHTDIALCKHSYYASRGLNQAYDVGEFQAAEIPLNVWQNDYCGVAWCNNTDELNEILKGCESVC